MNYSTQSAGSSPPTSSARHPLIGIVAMIMPILGLTAATNAQTLALAESRFDAGTVQKGSIIKRDFVIHNTGTADLRIADVKPKCACMTAAFDKKIKPGAEGKISVAIDTKSFQGKIVKIADVLSNDPTNPSTTITVAADVNAYVTVLPYGFVRIQAEAGTPTTQEVTLSSDHPAFKPVNVITPKPYLKASLTPGASAAQWKLAVTCDATAPEGLLGDAITVQTSVPEQPELSIAISGFVRPKGTQKASSQAAMAGGPKMTNQDVIELIRGGLSEEVVVNSVKQASRAEFDITPTGLLALKKAHVPDLVIVAMQGRSSATHAVSPSGGREAQSVDSSGTQPSSPCADVDYLGVIQAVTGGGEMAGWNAYGGRVRNRASYTKEVDLAWTMNGRAETGTFRVPAGQFLDLNLGQGSAPPTNVRVIMCR